MIFSFSTLGDFKFPCQKNLQPNLQPLLLACRGFHGMAAVGRLGAQLHPLRRVHAAGTGMQHGVHARLFRATDGDAWAIFSPQKPTAPGCGNKTKEDLCGIFPCFFLTCFFMGKITLKREETEIC